MRYSFDFDRLEHKSFTELFALKHETERRLETLRRREPVRYRSESAYRAWIGRNVECIKHLEMIRNEITRRKERAARAGISVFAFDWKVLVI